MNVPDTEYTGDNGTGEIWLRGPSLMKGYFKMEEETKKVMTSEGWFKTGDIGTMNQDGTLSITDRVKNLVKLAHGEYVALEKCEAIYRDSKEIKNICIIADNGCPVLLAVVEPAHSGVKSLPRVFFVAFVCVLWLGLTNDPFSRWILGLREGHSGRPEEPGTISRTLPLRDGAGGDCG